MLTITRIFHFCAGHRLFRSEWSDAQNTATFGLCANPAGHGHNYVLEVSVSGCIDPETGMIFNLRELKDLVNAQVVMEVDHKNLNTDVAWLYDKIPTTEVFIESIWQRLETHVMQKIPSIRLEKLVLRETPHNVVTKTRAT